MDDLWDGWCDDRKQKTIDREKFVRYKYIEFCLNIIVYIFVPIRLGTNECKRINANWSIVVFGRCVSYSVGFALPVTICVGVFQCGCVCRRCALFHPPKLHTHRTMMKPM